ncbi:alpha/beta hydrolase [bacterium]|nr:MAG: alpha/beta hydrolase [bacterium]
MERIRGVDDTPSEPPEKATKRDPMAHLEPTTQAFIDQLAAGGGPALYELSYEDARAVLRGAAGHQTKVAASVEDQTWATGPTGQLDVRIVRPEGASGPLPVILYCHGGGWVMGDKDTHEPLVRKLAAGVNAAVVFVSYTPAPDAQYPVQNEQAYAALEYVVAHAAELNVDASRLAIAGDSVGGNMTAILAQQAKARKGPAVTAQVLLYPVTDYMPDFESYRTFADGPWLTTKAMQYFWDAYLPDPTKAGETTVSPLRATPEQLSDLPEALVIVDENDILHEEGEAYARKLADAGVRTTSVRINGTFHDFLIVDGVAGTPAVTAALDLAVNFLKRKLA